MSKTRPSQGSPFKIGGNSMPPRLSSHRRRHARTVLGWFAASLALSLVLLSAGCGAVRAHPTTSEADLIAELMVLQPGMDVADVGAGDGAWAEELANRVGTAGHVFATEIHDDELEDIRERMEGAGLENVTIVRGDADDTQLPDACCDAILLRLVYHHLTDPEPMNTSLHRALRPGGLLIVIDFEPKEQWDRPEGVPDRGGHGVLPDDVIAEMTTGGFTVVSQHEHWDGHDDRFCVVLSR
jgi:SAM-dependent methyltransferase